MDFLFPFDDTRSNTILLAVVVAAFGCGLFICSWSMKLACGFCGGRTISILRGLVASVACTMVGSGVVQCTSRFDSESSPWIAALYGLFAAVVTLAIILVQNPLRALFTYIVYTVIGTAFSLAVAAAVAAMIYFAVPENELERLAKHFAQQDFAQLGKSASVETKSAVTTLANQVSAVQEVHLPQPPAVANPPQAKKLAPGVKANPFVK